MNFTKIIGWVTFLAGGLIIGYTLYSSYNIFTAKSPVPEFFKFEQGGTQTSGAQKGGILTAQEQLQQQIGQMLGEQLKGLMPVDFLPKISNLIVWSMLAGILIWGGGQISNLGIKLLKS